MSKGTYVRNERIEIKNKYKRTLEFYGKDDDEKRRSFRVEFYGKDVYEGIVFVYKRKEVSCRNFDRGSPSDLTG